MADNLEIVEEVSKATPTGKFIAGWSGAKAKGPTEYVFSDGFRFMPYPASPLVADYTYIERGCSDVTGEKFEPYMNLVIEGYTSRRAKQRAARVTYINSLEMKVPENEAEALERIRNYEGPLRFDPEDWPEPYKTAWIESH